MLDFLGTLIIVLGLVFIAFGIIGIYKFKNFYPRILVASKIDTVGYITLMTGVMIKNGWSFFSLKVLIIVILMVIVNPLVTHSIARSAYYSGYKVRKE
ncbi:MULTISPECIES: monovalent cation/H(+) antiporter subunit G [unclassified Fusibacter]|uniref:monovalent cation/H(+) antiporter subunit G n=1 Tax=unclassified Fusibacter TaxID=2624464 RepID=UPI001013106A|nr:MULTISPECIES: monovalent cation/H(+) antiporter subunit G [unclassified Fusibacter]MCK8059655.1 monovalent cation/H(+) antiporter subunit G [Fusibacter sp. A2]NPE21456.1 monovalent cation/H(+) antiporter subunit G [Fusibacter sp. A1]RXV61867.1 cation:proton antiporter [Fusibacter sp. A1]